MLKLKEFPRIAVAGDGGDGGGGSSTPEPSSGGTTLMSTPSPTTPEVTPEPSGSVTPSDNSDPSPSNNRYDLSQMFDMDGKFQKNWSSQLGEEFIDHTPTLDRFTDVGGLAKSYMEAKKMLSQKALTYPSADATDEQRAEWNKQALVSESAEKYLETRWGEDKEGLKEFQDVTGINDEQLNKLVEESIKAGVPAPALNQQLDTFKALSEEMISSFESQHAQTQEQALAELKKSFGTDTDARVQTSIQAFDRVANMAGLDQESIVALKSDPNIGGNPNMVRMFAAIGDSISDAAYKGHNLGSELATQFKSPMDHASDIMNNPDNPDHSKFHAGDINVNKKVDSLISQSFAKK